MLAKNVTPQELAEQWCAKHPEVISSSSGSAGEHLSAMDKAVKIISLETATDKGKSDLFRAAAPFGVSFLDSIPGQPHPATDFLGARDVLVVNSKASNASKEQTTANAAAAVASLKPSTTSVEQQQQNQNQTQNNNAELTLVPAGQRASRLESCPYCQEPSSRFCKETGRRHETTDEKGERRWKHIFRQLSLASSFVSNVRLSKKNTCLESEGVELIF